MVKTSKPERGRNKMKVWLTIEPTLKEVSELLTQERIEGVSKTPLRDLVDRAYGLMIMGAEVTLKITTKTWNE